jgi:hypothetical protein
MSDSLLDAKAVAERLMVPSAFLPRGDLAPRSGRRRASPLHGRLL